MSCRRRTTSVSWASKVREGSWSGRSSLQQAAAEVDPGRVPRSVGCFQLHSRPYRNDSSQTLALILIVACLAGTATEATAAEPHGRAYLFRGMIDLIDWGMDQLAGRINRTGVAANINSHLMWRTGPTPTLTSGGLRLRGVGALQCRHRPTGTVIPLPAASRLSFLRSALTRASVRARCFRSLLSDSLKLRGTNDPSVRRGKRRRSLDAALGQQRLSMRTT